MTEVNKPPAERSALSQSQNTERSALSQDYYYQESQAEFDFYERERLERIANQQMELDRVDIPGWLVLAISVICLFAAWFVGSLAVLAGIGFWQWLFS